MKLVENKLTTNEWRIYNYLTTWCLGEAQAVSMKYLAENFEMSEREVRESIKNITIKKTGYTMIAAGAKGYYIPKEDEREKANSMLRARAESAIERLIANDPTSTNWLYTLITETKEKYPAPPQGQIQAELNGKRKDVNYTAEKYQATIATEIKQEDIVEPLYDPKDLFDL